MKTRATGSIRRNSLREGADPWFEGGGEMGERLRKLDWTGTSLGPMEQWPQTLRTTLRLMLHARHPMAVHWGPGFVYFYNDAYAPLMGIRHPEAFGKAVPEVWPEIWPVLEPQFEEVMRGRSTWDEEVRYVLKRNGFPEETSFTFSRTPIPDDDGEINGVLSIASEESERVFEQRRLRTLRALPEQLAQATTPRERCALVAEGLRENPYDLPFVLLYLLDEGGRAVPAGAVGPGAERMSGADWPFLEALASDRGVEIGDLAARFGIIRGEAWPEPVERAIVLPLVKFGQARAEGFLVAGVSPRLAFTREYREFFRLLAGSVATAVADARVLEEMRATEERLRLTLEAGGGVGTWDWDVTNDRLTCNEQLAGLFSIGAARIAGGAPLELFVEHMHPDDQERVRKTIRRVVEEGGDYVEEYRVVQGDGSIRWVHARGRCHQDATGRPVRFPGVLFDITERRAAEQALRESKDRLRAIFNGTYEYIGLISPDGRLVEANRAALTFGDFRKEEVVGRMFWETPWFTGTAGAPELVQHSVERAMAGEFVRFEAELWRPSGEPATIDISFYPVRSEAGEVVLIVPEGRDVTERKKLDRELERSNEELRRVNRELEEFAYVASHDLQEPLRMVNIYTQLLLRRYVGAEPEAQQYASIIEQGVMRMGGLIADLLTFSRSVHVEQAPAGEADLGAALLEALTALDGRIQESGAQIRTGPLPVVRGDTGQMAQVFQNILANAIKYRRRGGGVEIELGAERDGERWVVSVRDNGIGFDPVYVERIFGLFKRLHKDQYPGTGLGLAICQRIVERYGGRIWAEGRLGEGATIFFALPGVG